MPQSPFAAIEQIATEVGPPDLTDARHPLQTAFVRDPAKRKIAVAGRRAGKSEAIAAWLLEGASAKPGETSVFVARTAGHARRILWETLKRIEQRHGLGLKFREDILTVFTANGHQIWLSGAKDFTEVEKFRGPRYWRVAIDEAGSFPNDLLEYLVEDIFDPALMDLDGSLALTGTPGPVPAGFFYTRSTGDGGIKWPTHTWTCLDNPYVHGAEYLARKLKDNGWTEEHPTYRREYLGQWILDMQALVLPFDMRRNGRFQNVEDVTQWLELPAGEWTYGLCIDLGAGGEASTAFVVGCTRRGHPEFYAVHAEKRADMIPSSIAAYAQVLIKQFGAKVLVLDEGGLGKGYGDEFRKTFDLDFVPAKKAHKTAYLQMVHGDMLAGTLRIHPQKCRELTSEMQIAQWNEERSDVDDRFEHHAIDGFVYLVRAMLSRYKPEREDPKPGTQEWWERERAKNRRQAEERVRKAGKQRRWG